MTELVPADVPSDAASGTAPEANPLWSPTGWARTRAIGIGVAVGVLLCALNILTLFRAGTAFGGSTLVALLGAAGLKVFGKVRWAPLFVIFSVASSGYFATAAIDWGSAALVLDGHRLPSWPILLVLALAANGAGIGLGLLVADRFLADPALTYPTIKPATSLLGVLSTTERRIAKPLLISAAAAALVSGLAGGADLRLAPGAPSFAAVTLSPLLVGVGLLLGARSARWLTLGLAYSVVVWLWSPSTPYTAHLTSDEILPAAVGLMAGVALIGLLRDRAVVGRSVSAGVRLATAGGSFARRVRQGVAVAAALVGTGILIWRAGPLTGVLLAVALFAFTGFAVLFMNRAGGEVGIVPLAPVMYLGLITLLLLGSGPVWGALGAATICGLGVSSVYFVYARRIASTAPVGERVGTREVVATQLVGGLTGSLAGVAVIVLAARAGLIGSPSLPVPTAQALAFVVAGTQHLTAIAGLVLGAAVAGGGLLTTLGGLPTTLGLGIVLPPAATLALVAGGLGRSAIQRFWPAGVQHIDVVASGLIIGDGLVGMVTLSVHAMHGHA